jgi:hypothetical protein
MSLEKSIQKLTQVIQAAQLGRQEPMRFDEPNMPIPQSPSKVPQNGWDCYWARKRMEEDPNNMGTCCFDPSTPIPHTKICYSRSSPGGPVTVTKTRED